MNINTKFYLETHVFKRGDYDKPYGREFEIQTNIEHKSIVEQIQADTTLAEFCYVEFDTKRTTAKVWPLNDWKASAVRLNLKRVQSELDRRERTLERIFEREIAKAIQIKMPAVDVKTIQNLAVAFTRDRNKPGYDMLFTTYNINVEEIQQMAEKELE